MITYFFSTLIYQGVGSDGKVLCGFMIAFLVSFLIWGLIWDVKWFLDKEELEKKMNEMGLCEQEKNELSDLLCMETLNEEGEKQEEEGEKIQILLLHLSHRWRKFSML